MVVAAETPIPVLARWMLAPGPAERYDDAVVTWADGAVGLAPTSRVFEVMSQLYQQVALHTTRFRRRDVLADRLDVHSQARRDDLLGRPACQCCNTSTTSVTWNCLLAIRPPSCRHDFKRVPMGQPSWTPRR